MVKRKFVVATEREVSVGVAKPRREKSVAEKYIREFWVVVRFEDAYTIEVDGSQEQNRSHVTYFLMQ